MTPDSYKNRIIKLQKSGRRSVLLKGPSGSGKTFQYRRLVEGGLHGLYACVDEHTGTIDDLDVDAAPLQALDIPLTIRDKDPEKQDFIAMMDFLRSGEHEYDFLFFDSLMNYADNLVSWLKYTKGVTGYDLWGLFGDKMKQVLKLLVSLTQATQKKPLYVICTWGVEIAQDWEGNRAIVPIVDGKMVGPRIDYYFDDVFMLRKRELAETGDVEFIAYTGGTHEFDAKVSSGAVVLPTKIKDPNLYRIIKKIEGEL